MVCALQCGVGGGPRPTPTPTLYFDVVALLLRLMEAVDADSVLQASSILYYSDDREEQKTGANTDTTLRTGGRKPTQHRHYPSTSLDFCSGGRWRHSSIAAFLVLGREAE